jgi:large subunit ribosomal protein LP0
MGGKSETKAAYFDKLKSLLEEYKSIFIVTVDNVSSQQMHEIRQAMRGKSVVLMGKNTMVCVQPCIRCMLEEMKG